MPVAGGDRGMGDRESGNGGVPLRRGPLPPSSTLAAAGGGGRGGFFVREVPVKRGEVGSRRDLGRGATIRDPPSSGGRHTHTYVRTRALTHPLSED